MCEEGKTIVVASDRMVVTEFPSMPMQSETDCIKFEVVSPNALMLYTGSFNDQQAIRNKVGEIGTCSPSDLATRIQSACESHHDDRMEWMLRRVGTNLKALGEEAVRQRREATWSLRV